MVKANVFDKNGTIVGRKFEKALKLLDKIEDLFPNANYEHQTLPSLCGAFRM